MRAESEKKTHSTSVRMSRNQYEQIEKNAAAQNMNISQFMIHAAVHSEQKKKRKSPACTGLFREAGSPSAYLQRGCQDILRTQ